MCFIKGTFWDSYVANKCCVRKAHAFICWAVFSVIRTEQLQAVQAWITEQNVPEKSIVPR